MYRIPMPQWTHCKFMEYVELRAHQEKGAKTESKLAEYKARAICPLQFELLSDYSTHLTPYLHRRLDRSWPFEKVRRPFLFLLGSFGA